MVFLIQAAADLEMQRRRLHDRRRPWKERWAIKIRDHFIIIVVCMDKAGDDRLKPLVFPISDAVVGEVRRHCHRRVLHRFLHGYGEEKATLNISGLFDKISWRNMGGT